MKKILIISFILICLIPIFLFGTRFRRNVTQIVPYPFNINQKLELDQKNYIPILIAGDRMATRLSSFIPELQEKLSKKFSKPLKVSSIATDGENIHRTFNKIKQLKRLPYIIIFLSNKDETYESIFKSNYTDRIRKNFELYENDYIRTMMMIFPWTSRLIFHPLDRITLGNKIVPDKNQYEDHTYQKRQGLSYKLYEAAFSELATYTKKRNSILIPITTPVNLRLEPDKICYGSFDEESYKVYKDLLELVENNNIKEANELAKELALTNPGNSKVRYLYAKVLAKLNQLQKSQSEYEFAVAMDCHNKRANPVYNQILKEVSSKHNIKYFDFHQMVTDQMYKNHTFIDETYPQDVYFEYLIEALANRIKVLLKL